MLVLWHLSGQFTGGTVTLGARGDSLYEVLTFVKLSQRSAVSIVCPSLCLQYLMKQYVLAGGLADPTLSRLSSHPDPIASDKGYFTTMIEMFDRSVKVCSLHLLLLPYRVRVCVRVMIPAGHPGPANPDRRG